MNSEAMQAQGTPIPLSQVSIAINEKKEEKNEKKESKRVKEEKRETKRKKMKTNTHSRVFKRRPLHFTAARRHFVSIKRK